MTMGVSSVAEAGREGFGAECCRGCEGLRRSTFANLRRPPQIFAAGCAPT